jgi:hypothetical protein
MTSGRGVLDADVNVEGVGVRGRRVLEDVRRVIDAADRVLRRPCVANK